MQLAGLFQQLKSFRRQTSLSSEQLMRQPCPARPMSGVVLVVSTAGIMEDGKEFHHLQIRLRYLSQAAAILEHTRPVPKAMDAIHWKKVSVKDLLQ